MSTSNAVTYGTTPTLRAAIAGEVLFPAFRADPSEAWEEQQEAGRERRSAP